MRNRASGNAWVLEMGVVLGLLFVGGMVTPLASGSKAGSGDVARGKYLVESLGMCGDCHTPQNEKGKPIKDQALSGAPVLFKPTVPVPAWADKSPNLVGLKGWEDADAIKFLMTGIAYNGLPARPPMPQFRMSKEDATAVVAYLKSLSAPGK